MTLKYLKGVKLFRPVKVKITNLCSYITIMKIGKLDVFDTSAQ